MEVYVRPFVPPSREGSLDTNKANGAVSPSVTGGSVQVSANGGIEAVWRADGKELFYLNPAGTMMAAPITVRGDTVLPGTPMTLFPHTLSAAAWTRVQAITTWTAMNAS